MKDEVDWAVGVFEKKLYDSEVHVNATMKDLNETTDATLKAELLKLPGVLDLMREASPWARS